MNNEQIKARENIEKGQELYMKLKLNHFEGRNGQNRVEMFRPKTPDVMLIFNFYI